MICLRWVRCFCGFRLRQMKEWYWASGKKWNSRTVSGRNVYFCQMLSYLRNYIGTGWKSERNSSYSHEKFKEHGTLISFDVKFRGNLWSVWKHWSGGQDWKRRCLYCRCFVWNFEISRRSVTGSIYRKRSKRPEEYRPRRFSGNGSLRDSWTDSGT